MSEPWDRVDGEDFIDEYLEEELGITCDESDFGENPFGEYDLEFLFQDEPLKEDKTMKLAQNALKFNPKIYKGKKK